MPYIIADELYATKAELTARCREILAATPDGQGVEEKSVPFLIDLFQYHDEWQKKAEGGVRNISTQTTPHGTRCFILVRNVGDAIDISFPHAIRLVKSSRTVSLLPQALRDFRNASRNAVRGEIFAFRDRSLQQRIECPYTGEQLNHDNCAVDHTPPKTFDALLFNFCREQGINPLQVVVGSKGGTVAVLSDLELMAAWQAYHRANANLRLLSKLGNLQLSKTSVQWGNLWE